MTISEYNIAQNAQKLTPDEAAQESSCWYLSHFAVVNPNKPGNIRLVFDGAAKSQDINDNLLTGPDILCFVLTILLNFLQREVGFCSDV